MTIRETTVAAPIAGARACDAAAMRLGRSLSLAIALGALVGCGSESVHQLPPREGPPRSPAPAHAPAGTVTAVGTAPVATQPGGVAALAGGTRIAVVSVRE